jgi:hypothetical protein
VSPRGRRASLPGDGPETSRGLLDGQDCRILVRCFDEQERKHKDYDFTGLPVAEGCSSSEGSYDQVFCLISG